MRANVEEVTVDRSDVKKEYGVKQTVDRKDGQKSRLRTTCKKLRKIVQLL
jgi:hypothetical protein